MASIAHDLSPASERPAALDHVGRRVAGVALFVGLIALAVVALPGLDEIRAQIGGAKVQWLALAGLFEVGSVLSYVVVFRPTFCRKLPWGLSYRIAVAEQATNVLVPTGGAGGLALGAWALGRAGMGGERIARRSVAFFVITSGANFATAIVVGIALAVGLLPSDVALWAALVPAGLAVGVALLVLAVLPAALARVRAGDHAEPEGRWARRGLAAARALGDGVADARSLLASLNPAIIGGALGYMAFDIAALWAAFHALDAAPASAAFVLAYVLGQLGGLIPLPGGIGGTDGGLVGALAAYGTPASTATAAVLSYRLFQLGLPVLLGAVALTTLRNDPGPVAEGC